MLDYRGYGQSEGQPGLPEVYRDIDAAFAWLDQAPEVKGTERVLLGQSLGGALAIHYLVEHPQRQGQFKALVFDGVPASYRGIARHMLDGSWLTWPLQVPLSWLVPDATAPSIRWRGFLAHPCCSFTASTIPLCPSRTASPCTARRGRRRSCN